MIDTINFEAFILDKHEHICPKCHTVHWTPTGPAYCGDD